MLLQEVVPILVGATPFELATKETWFGVVDCSDMSPGACPLGITCVAYGTQVS
jgi:hypothetical protein